MLRVEIERGRVLVEGKPAGRLTREGDVYRVTVFEKPVAEIVRSGCPTLGWWYGHPRRRYGTPQAAAVVAVQRSAVVLDTISDALDADTDRAEGRLAASHARSARVRRAWADAKSTTVRTARIGRLIGATAEAAAAFLADEPPPAT